MTLYEFHSSLIQNAPMISKAVESVITSGKHSSLVLVAEIGGTEKRLAEAGRKSANQDLILACTLAEEVRTFLMQVVCQLTSPPVSHKAQSFLSELFEEFSTLLEGIYLVGELSLQAQAMVASYAERASAIIIAQALQEKGVQAQAICTRHAHIANNAQASDNFRTKAIVDFRDEISTLSQDGTILIVPASLQSLATTE